MDGGPRILIVSGGYGGMHTAPRLERLLHPGEATVTVADSRSYMTYQPLLAGAAAGNLEPRHVVVPLRAVLRRTQVIKAAVRSVDHARKVAYLTDGDGGDRAVGYDMLVLARLSTCATTCSAGSTPPRSPVRRRPARPR